MLAVNGVSGQFVFLISFLLQYIYTQRSCQSAFVSTIMIVLSGARLWD